MIGSLFQISKNTFREILREPIYLLLLLSSLVLIGISPVFTLFVFREQVKLVVDSAMATSLVFGWITAVLCASHAIAREINQGTALLLLSKPVKRPVFIIAKTIGILAALAVFWFVTGLATLIAVRVAKDQFALDYRIMGGFFGALALSFLVGGIRNFITRASFPMSAVMSLCIIMSLASFIVFWIPLEGEHVGFSWEIVPALILILYAVWAMGTLATALSTRLELVSNLLVCSAIFVIGLMSDYLLGQAAENSILAAVLYACIPNWQLLWMADALAADKLIPLEYVLFGGIYILCFVALFVALAVSMFWHREIGRQSVT